MPFAPAHIPARNLNQAPLTVSWGRNSKKADTTNKSQKLTFYFSGELLREMQWNPGMPLTLDVDKTWQPWRWQFRLATATDPVKRCLVAHGGVKGHWQVPYSGDVQLGFPQELGQVLRRIDGAPKGCVQFVGPVKKPEVVAADQRAPEGIIGNC